MAISAGEKLGLMSVLLGLAGLTTGLYFNTTRTQASGGGGIVHPEFKIGDTVQEVNGKPTDSFYQLKITGYTLGAPPYYGIYICQVVSGSLAGTVCSFWVSQIDGYYVKIA